MSQQEQFLNVVDRDEAESRFRAALALQSLAGELVALDAALDRVLAEDILSSVDVPSFDRSNFDGFAVRAADTYGAREEAPRSLELRSERLVPGAVPSLTVDRGAAVSIATGAAVPRGADAIVMVEHADIVAGRLLVQKAVTPGFGVAFAGTDIAVGELVLRRGERLTSRETGVLAAIGRDRVEVVRRPIVAIVSTGNELVAPGEPMTPGQIYDSNARILADAVREQGGEPLLLGIVRDDLAELRQRLARALAEADVVILSGGTSKGEGDLSFRAVAELRDPGIVVHGVALKPGKPVCLAASQGKPVVVLPGFPTSAIFTFHEFVAPVIALLAGRVAEERSSVAARLAVQVNSEIGRTEYLLVGLVEGEGGLAAFPMGKGSGSVTTFSKADGFVTIGRHEEIVAAGSIRPVHLLGREIRPADLVVIGSHCVGLDALLGQLRERGLTSKFLAVGSTAGLQAVARGECDLAGIHLFDPASGKYNQPFLTAGARLIEGYGRRQGFVFRRDDDRFAGATLATFLERIQADAGLQMVNRNQGSGTRILLDQLLAGVQPPGYTIQAKTHSAVAAAISQGRADWGLAIESAARAYDLAFLPVRDERYDFAVAGKHWDHPSIAAFRQLLEEPETRRRLRAMGFV